MTAGRSLRIGIDATPLLGHRTGIGIYVENLLRELAVTDDLALAAGAFSVRRRNALHSLPSGVRVVHRPVPARLLHRAWLRGDVPSAEAVLGRQDVVHGTNYVLPPPRRAAGVVNVHDLSFVYYPELVNAASLSYRELVPRALSRAAAVLLLTQAMADEVAAEYAVPADRLHVTHLGVDSSWLAAAGSPRPAGYPVDYLLAVGTLEPRKGLDVLLRAYRTLLADDAELPPLVLVGPSGWGPALDHSGLPRDRVILPGYADPATVKALVANARVLAYPSRYEGFGLPPLEALAAGTPVVASDLAAIREVLGPHACLVPPDDPDALAGALAAVLAAPPPAAARDAAREHARQFTWAETAARTARVYRLVS